MVVTVRRLALAVSLAAAAVALVPAPASAAGLRAGVGKADITPKVGYYLGGWTRADRIAGGQHTRLHSRALVLERDGRKLALVAVDLFMVPGGLVKHVGDALRARGFGEQNLLISASHTHSGPGGYANFKTFNTAAPSLQTATDPLSFYHLLDPKPADRQLYTFLVNQIATAVRRADEDLGPAVGGWGVSSLEGITRNRSVEAHLANHGVIREYAEGSAELDPAGVIHTIDPKVSVLRVDKVVRRTVRRGRGKRSKRKRVRVRVPIGAWTNFADHGTVTKSSFQYYNQDHHASAIHDFEEAVRREGKVPAGQEVLNVYGNSNEGDQSAGLDRSGPAASDFVGQAEASAMLRAWRDARRALSSTPAFDFRWTRICFCGQMTEGGPVASSPVIGMPFLTGSEEERGPLYDVTQVPFEGRRAPASTDPAQGNKSGIPISEVPRAVPLMSVRLGTGMIVSLPGEPTTGVGERVRESVGAAISGSGVGHIVVAGLTNEFIQYFTTPEEYERQHYEGGSTLFGKYSSNLLKLELAELSRRLVTGEPAQAAHPLDPTNGVVPDGPPFGDGAASGDLTSQPAPAYRRLQHARIAWKGGPEGLDRPVERPFVTVERRVKRRWRHYTSDYEGLDILWTVDAEGRHEARWDIPHDAPRSIYRIVVSAKRYRLVSRPFRVLASLSLGLRRVPAGPGRVAVVMDYPQAVRDVDLTHRPESAAGGFVRFRIGRRTVQVHQARGSVFSAPAPAGAEITVEGRDRFRNLVSGKLSARG